MNTPVLERIEASVETSSDYDLTVAYIGADEITGIGDFLLKH